MKIQSKTLGISIATVIVAIAFVVVIGQQPVNMHLNDAAAQKTQMPANVGLADHFVTDGPYVELTFEPKQITLKKGQSADVTATLTYVSSNKVQNPPVSVKLQSPGVIIGLSSVSNLTPQDRIGMIDAATKSGIEPAGFFYTSHLLPNPGGPVNLNSGETKTITMKLVIPVTYPDELLNKPVNVNIGGITEPFVGAVLPHGIEVTVTG